MNRSVITAALFSLLVFTPFATGYAAQKELAIEIVKKQDIDDLRYFDGVVEAINRSTVSAQTAGRIVHIDFDVNDFVKAGEVILRFADVEHRSRLEQAESSLNAAVATRIGAEEDLKRIEQLYTRGTVAKARFDNAKAIYETSKARAGTAQAAVEQAREQLAYTVVKAPYGGIVVERHVQIGEFASSGQALMTGFSLDNLRVKVAVPQNFARLIRQKNHAIIFDGAGGSIVAEKLTVFPYADAKSNTVTIRAILPQKTKLVFPGMLVKIAFKTGNRNVLMISNSSIVKRGEVTGVYVSDDETGLQLQQIRTGRSVGDQIEVLTGLNEGQNIAADPYKAMLRLKSKSRDAQ